MASSSSSSSSSASNKLNYDVFLSFIDGDYGDGGGDDCRTSKNFIGQLYEALIQRDYRIFADEHDKRSHNEHVTCEFLKTIEESKLSIVVFSKNFGSSIWCLDELVKMLECKHDQMGHTVFPVFYKVDPSHFRKQNGILEDTFAGYAERFKSEMEKEKLKRWRNALTEAGNLSGWHLQDVADEGVETTFIKAIVEEVSLKVKERQMNIDNFLVGIDSRTEAINSLLLLGSTDVRIIGIYGIGGMGKTTITKAVYNHILRDFEGSTFLGSVREVSEHHNGLTHLQQQLLSDILMKQNIHINNVDRGINLIKQRLCSRKVLVVLDDVDNSNQIDALVRERSWFGPGSRIIITTRDQHFLYKLDVDEIYEVEKLNSQESLRLFCHYAFGRLRLRRFEREISEEIVSYLGGLPLALQVLGSSLRTTNMGEWRSALEKLKQIPDEKIQEKLKLSFDTLDSTEKEIFLDIACFFTGMDKDIVIKILRGCDFYPEIGISVLRSRSLLLISEKNQLGMHDLIRHMGREIVREESPDEPGKRSRLWLLEDVYDTLMKNSGTEAVEGVSFNIRGRQKKVCLSTEAFLRMDRLRLLQANYLHEHFLDGSFSFVGRKHLFKELRWLCWHGFPLRSIPKTFCLENLVVLDLQYSNIKQVWQRSKPEYLGKLKVLNLDHCRDLTKTPNFLAFPGLEILTLEGCTGLVEVHNSLGELNNLLILNLKDCTNLWRLPGSIWKLKSLRSLILSGCSKISELPRELGNMESLTELLADGTAIRKLPISIGILCNLQSFSLGGCKGSPSKSWRSFIRSLGSRRKDAITSLPASFSCLHSLRRLSLRDCSLSGLLPNDLGKLSSLQELDLASNSFCELPASISHLPQLRSLWLQNCTNLGSLPELPSSLSVLEADGCTSIEKLPNLGSASSLHRLNLSQSNICSLPADINGLSQLQFLMLSNCTRLQSLPMLPSNIMSLDAEGCLGMERLSSLANLKKIKSLTLSRCSKLIEVEGLERLETAPIINMEWCSGLRNASRDKLFQGMSEPGVIDILVPGGDIPEWFSWQSAGPSINFEVPPSSNHKVQGLIICAVYAADEEVDGFTDGPEATFINMTNGLDWKHSPKSSGVSVTNKDHIWVSNVAEPTFLDQLEGGNQVYVSIEMGDPVHVKKCGIHLLQDSSSQYNLGIKESPKEDNGAGCSCIRFNEEQDSDWFTETCPEKPGEPEYLGKLKVLNLHDSKGLTKTPNFSRLPSLEILTLEGCISLVEVHESIGELNNLLILNMRNCKNLRRLPRGIWNLKSLESLIISGCSKINELPEELGNLESLTELLADGTAISKLPNSIGLLHNLKSLSIGGGCKRSPSKSWNSCVCSMGSPRSDDAIMSFPFSFSGLRFLRRLRLRDCNLSGMLPDDLGSLSSLQELDLAFNNFSDLPAGISRLNQLQSLWLQNCTKLRSLPELPSSLKYLDADGCSSMTKLSNLASASSLQVLDLTGNNICSLPEDIYGLSQLQVLRLKNCTMLQTLPMLPSNINALDAGGCTMMERLPSLENLKKLYSVDLNDSTKIVEVEGLHRLVSRPTIHMERCNGLANTFRDNLFQGMSEPGIIDIFVPGGEIPDWFSYQSAGSSLYFEVPPLLNHKIQGLIICAIYAAADGNPYVDTNGPKATLINRNGLEWEYGPLVNGISGTNQDHMWVSNISEAMFVDQLQEGDQVDVSIRIGDDIQVKKCGIHLFQGTSSPYALGVEQDHREDNGTGIELLPFQ